MCCFSLLWKKENHSNSLRFLMEHQKDSLFHCSQCSVGPTALQTVNLPNYVFPFLFLHSFPGINKVHLFYLVRNLWKTSQACWIKVYILSFKLCAKWEDMQAEKVVRNWRAENKALRDSVCFQYTKDRNRTNFLSEINQWRWRMFMNMDMESTIRDLQIISNGEIAHDQDDANWCMGTVTFYCGWQGQYRMCLGERVLKLVSF